jgi:SAM-dependent methyltransferase
MNNEPSMHPAKAEESVYFHNDESGSKILVRILERDIGKTILEVGAGVGCVTRELALVAHSVVSLEPNRTLFEELRRKTSQLSNVTCLNVTLEEFVRTRSSPTVPLQKFDSVVYINVLEHIEHDARELTLAREVLSSVGRVLIVVPAHSWLYSKVDRLSGHFRRYSRSGLTARLRQAGLRPMRLEYFDSVGLLPYLVMYKLLRSTAVSGTNAFVYSKLILPVSKVLHRLSRGRLVGKNLVAVAELAEAAHHRA